MKRLKQWSFWALVIVTALYFVVRESAQLAVHAGWLDLGMTSGPEAIRDSGLDSLLAFFTLSGESGCGYRLVTVVEEWGE